MQAFRVRVVVAVVLGVGTVLAAVPLPERAEAGAAFGRCDVAEASGCTGRRAGVAPSNASANPPVSTPATSAASRLRPDVVVPKTPVEAAAAARLATRALAQVCGPPFVHGDRRLGPVVTPNIGYFGYLLRGYVPYGGLTPWQFLNQYWDRSLTPNNWRYPPDMGYLHGTGYSNGLPLKVRAGLPVGLLVDRFSPPIDEFLAPAGTSFSARSIPPDFLNNDPADPAHLCNYHLYAVAKRFDVDAGPIAPAFQQPGLGVQYVLNSSYIPGAPTPVTVQYLLDNGYLVTIY